MIGAVLSRREATLRSAATVCLAGIALVQAIGLRSVFVEGWRFAVLSLAAMVMCVGLGLVLAAAPAAAAGPVWRLVASASVVVLAGWALPRAFTVPGLDETRGEWASVPGSVCGGLAAACLAAAGLAGRPTRPAARALATALAVMVALAPGVWVLLRGLGPGAAGGGQSLATGRVHGHDHSSAAVPEAIRYRRAPG